MKDHEIPNVSLQQWYMSGDGPSVFRQLVQRGDHRFCDDFFPSTYYDGIEYDWIRGMVDNLIWGEDWHYAVMLDGQPVGCINLVRGRGNYSRTAVLHLILLPEVCGLGIGTQAVGQILTKAAPSIDRVEATVFGDNPAAVHVLTNNGFRHEGYLRNAIRKNGILYDLQYYGFILPPKPAGEVARQEVQRKKRIYQQMLSL